MDRNLLLAFALSFAVLMLWTTLVDPPKPTVKPPTEAGSPAAAPEETPAAQEAPGLPALEPAAAAPTPSAPAIPAAEGELTLHETALYRAQLDSRGGVIRHWELSRFDSGPKHGRQPIVLTTGEEPYDGVLATPFDELGLGDLSQAIFQLERSAPGVFLFSHTHDGVEIQKRYAFGEAGYDFELTLRVANRSQRPIAPRFSVLFPAASRSAQDFTEQALAVLHEGSVERHPLSGFGKAGFFGGAETLLEFPREVDWAGVETTYFIAALLPDTPAKASARLVATRPGEAGVAQVYFDPETLPPGQAAEHVFRAYLGPKEPELLEALGGGLPDSIDLGWAWFRPLTRLFGTLLHMLHDVVRNYGVAIIILTVLVRLVTAPLTNRQMRSMERMRALSPKLTELREKYADDRQKQSEEMMRLYRQEGVNPLGGCLPMVLQLPVFIGLFYALRSSIQLRQAPFFAWIDDLSAPDALFEIPGIGIPLRVLPLIMGATMIVQQKITPMQTMDPAQQRMMTTIMPIMMTVVFYQFPSGLVLYWMVSNVLAIAHQLWIGKRLHA